MEVVQLENGYTKIANELMDALISFRISGQQRQCLDFIIRKTYGWNKKEDNISLSQFVVATGLKKQNVVRSLKQLQNLNLIVIKNDNKVAKIYRINKRYTTWKSLSKTITLKNKLKSLSKTITSVIKTDNPALSKQSTTKDTITKDTITKENSPSGNPSDCEFPESEKELEENNKFIKDLRLAKGV